MQIDIDNFCQVQLINFTEASKDDLLYGLKMRNHPNVRRWMYTQEEIRQESHLDFVENLFNDARNQYLLVKQKEKIIGVIYFNQIDYENQEAAFGLYVNLFKPLKGGGRLLQELILLYAQDFLKLKTLYLEVMADNLRAISLYNDYGFIETRRIQKFGSEVLIMTKSLSL